MATITMHLKRRMELLGLQPLRTQEEVAGILGIKQQVVAKTEDRALTKLTQRLKTLAELVGKIRSDQNIPKPRTKVERSLLSTAKEMAQLSIQPKEGVGQDGDVPLGMFLDWGDRKSTGGKFGRIVWKL